MNANANAAPEFVAQWEKMGSAHFWTPPSSASGRRSYEKYHSRKLDTVIDGHRIEGEICVDCSCKNIYVNRTLLVDGAKKRITALKKLI